MKKLSKSKNYLFAIGYWLIFFFIPLIVVRIISETSHNYVVTNVIEKFVFRVSPFMFIGVLFLANLPTIKSKIMFVVWGFILPIILMTLTFILAFSQMNIWIG